MGLLSRVNGFLGKMNAFATKASTVAPSVRVVDAEVFKAEIVEVLQSTRLVKQLRINLQKELKNIIVYINANNFEVAIQRVDNVIRENAKNTVSVKVDEQLRKVKADLQTLLVSQKKTTPGGEKAPLFNPKDLLTYLSDISCFRDVLKAGPYLQALNVYINSYVTDADKLTLIDKKGDVYSQYKALEKYFKSFLKDHIKIPEGFPGPVSFFIDILEKLETKYPLAKKVIDKQKLVEDHINNFHRKYAQYQYSQFYWMTLRAIEESPTLPIEQVVASFAYRTAWAQQLPAKELLKEYLVIFTETHEKVYKGSHLQRELRQIKDQKIAKQVSVVTHAVPSPFPAEPIKRELPSSIITFAEMLSNRAPDEVVQDVQNYVTRVYCKNKPLSAHHLMHHFGIDEVYMDRIRDVAESLEMEFVFPSGKNTDPSQSNADSSEALQEALAKDAVYKVSQPVEVPSTAQDILAFLQKHGLRSLNVKQLLKQIQDKLIEGDRKGSMRKALIFALTHPTIGWHLKGGNFRVIELSRSYRMVVHQNTILHIVDHDQYDNALDFRK